ncbi:hypothetical protein [Petroclostridium sp. X23]|nr:hypothetical protein [Petroclostridium sp. X23]WHH59174.1 hypothetical protein QKW49_25870 [Petroclostridium sp. X23]
MFNNNSALVKIWVQQIKEGEYTEEQIPEISNLKEVVISLLKG